MKHLRNLLRTAICAVTVLTLALFHITVWAKGSIHDSETIGVAYQTGPGTNAGYGFTWTDSCNDYFNKNGYGDYSPPSYKTSPQPSACQIQYYGTGNTYVYMPNWTEWLL